jgi:hypothetical protein
MKKKVKKIFRIVLLILMTLALALYFLVFIAEATPPFYDQSLFGLIMVYLLFLIFLVAYYFSWKNERISGIIILFWYALLWISGLWIWTNAGMALGLATPIPILGVLLIGYSYLK